jgi:hypothetical protein
MSKWLDEKAERNRQALASSFLRIGSWIGGDRDGKSHDELSHSRARMAACRRRVEVGLQWRISKPRAHRVSIGNRFTRGACPLLTMSRASDFCAMTEANPGHPRLAGR